MAAVARRLVLGLILADLLACSAADRPPAEEDPAPSSAAVSTAIERSEASLREACDAGTYEPCNLHFVDWQGRVFCPASYRFCRADGHGWYDCGEPPPDTTTLVSP